MPRVAMKTRCPKCNVRIDSAMITQLIWLFANNGNPYDHDITIEILCPECQGRAGLADMIVHRDTLQTLEEYNKLA